MLVYDKFDVWQLPLEGASKPANLTKGLGAAQQVRLRVVRLDLPGGGGFGGRGGFGGGAPPAEDRGIDLTKPLTLSAYGLWDKRSGYWTLEPGKAPRSLLYEDRAIGQATKAENADRVIFTRQTFQEPPDWWASTTVFQSPRNLPDPHEAVLRPLPDGRSGDGLDEERRAAGAEGRADKVGGARPARPGGARPRHLPRRYRTAPTTVMSQPTG